jgi:hypothetical protein
MNNKNEKNDENAVAAFRFDIASDKVRCGNLEIRPRGNSALKSSTGRAQMAGGVTRRRAALSNAAMRRGQGTAALLRG